MSTNQVRMCLLKPLNFGVKHVKRHSNGTVGGPWCYFFFRQRFHAGTWGSREPWVKSGHYRKNPTRYVFLTC